MDIEDVITRLLHVLEVENTSSTRAALRRHLSNFVAWANKGIGNPAA